MTFLAYTILILLLTILGFMLVIRYRMWFVFIIYVIFLGFFAKQIGFGLFLVHEFYQFHSCEYALKSKRFGQVGESLFNYAHNVQIHGTLPAQKVMYVANYPHEFLEFIYPSIIQSKSNVGISIVARPANYLSSCYLHPDYNQIVVPAKGNSYSFVEKQIDEHVHVKNHSIWAYPQRITVKEKHTKYKLWPLREGLFHICQRMNLPIVPIVCSYLEDADQIHVYVGPVLDPTNQDCQKISSEVEAYFRHHLMKLKERHDSDTTV